MGTPTRDMEDSMSNAHVGHGFAVDISITKSVHLSITQNSSILSQGSQIRKSPFSEFRTWAYSFFGEKIIELSDLQESYKSNEWFANYVNNRIGAAGGDSLIRML